MDVENFNNIYDEFFIEYFKDIISSPFNKLIKFIFHNFPFILNKYNIKCTRCKHPTNSHSAIDKGVWKCIDCKSDDNICEFDKKINVGNRFILSKQI